MIYICKFNLKPESGKHKYTFANLCREDSAIELGDETEKIFLCADGTEDDVSGDMKTFLAYSAEGKAGNRFTEELENAVTEAKLHKKWRQDYMTLLEHYEQEREEGRKEGREQERKNTRHEHKKYKREHEKYKREHERVKELEAKLAKLK